MALTRVTQGVIKPDENYKAGIVTATQLDLNGNADISGDLNVGGVLTYEDVTSIDSVGIITAQQGIHVGAGVSAVGVGTFGGLDINGDIDVDGHTNLDNVSVAGVTTFAGAIDANGDLDVDGHTNLDNVSVAGVSTFANNVSVTGQLTAGQLASPTKITAGNPTLRFIQNNNSLSNRGYIQFFYNTSNLSARISGKARNSANGQLYFDVEKDSTLTNILLVDDAGVDITGNITATGTAVATGADINGDLDVDGHTNLDNVSIAGVVTATTFVGDLTGEASQVTIGNGANNRIVTASGANTLACDANFTFNGNVMEIGQSGSGGALYIHGDTMNNPGGRDAKVWIEDPTSNDWALHINKTSHNYGIQMSMADSASHAFYIIGGGAERFRITGSGEIAKCGSIYPRSADTFDIGDNGSSRWRNIYSEKLFADDLIRLGTPPWNEASGDFRTLSISGKTASSSGFIYLGNGVATTNADFDLARIRIHNGPTEVALITGTTDTSANDDGRIEFHTRNTGGSLQERLRIKSDGGILQTKTGGNANYTISRNESVGTTNQAIGVLDFASNTGHTVQARVMGKTRGTSNVGGDLVFETRADGGSLDERVRITGGGKVGINNNNPNVDLHIVTSGSSSEDGIMKIGGSDTSLGFILSYDQASNTVSKITANPTYTNSNALLKICVDGDANADQLVLNGGGKIGINIANNTSADLQVRTGNNGAGVFRLGGSNSNGVGMDITYSNSGATSTEFKQNYRATNNGALMKFDSGYMTFHTGTGGDTRLKISKHGQLLHGNSSEDQGWAVFFNAVGSGNDAGTAGADGGGDKGVNIRTDMGPTHLDLTGVDNFTLKLANQAYAGAGIANPQGTISKILFNTVTYNGWNSYGAICLDSQGVSAARGQMVFMLNDSSSSMNEKWRITNIESNSSNGQGLNVYGENTNHTNDAVLFAGKTGNADWCIKAQSVGNDYGLISVCGSGAAYSLAAYDGSNFRFRVRGDGVIFASNTTIQSISDVRLKENIVDANSQWDDIKALRFRNFNWKSDSGLGDGKTYLGLIAQEVEPISPNLVDLDAQTKEDIENGVPDPEYKSVKYSIVWMKAVKALQEAQARIEQLEAKVTALEGS